jgi:hypothetical protein
VGLAESLRVESITCAPRTAVISEPGSAPSVATGTSWNGEDTRGF